MTEARRADLAGGRLSQDRITAGSGLVVGAGPIIDESGRASMPARHAAPGPVAPSRADGNVANLEDDAIMARFVRDYLGLLDERVAAITAQLEFGDDLTAHVSLLSLESSSAMVGEKELSRIAGVIRSAVERKQKRGVPALLMAMTAEAGRVRERLRTSV